MATKIDDQYPSVWDLRVRICVALAATSILGMALLTAILYGYFRSGMRQDVRGRLRDIVSLAALQVDIAAHDSLREPANEGNATYLRVRANLQQIRDAATDVRFVYTMRRTPRNEIAFIVDADTNPGEIAHLGEIYIKPGPALAREFATLATPLVEDGFYTDKWGTWLSGYAPFRNASGERVGIIGIDIAADKVLAKEQHFLLAASALCAAAVPFLLLAAWALSGRLAMTARRAQETLSRRAALDRVIGEVSSALLQLDMDGVDRGIESALATIGTFSQADRAYVFLAREDGTRMDNTHEWCADGVEPEIEHLQNISTDEELPWFAKHMRNGDACHVPDVSVLPPEATLEREHFDPEATVMVSSGYSSDPVMTNYRKYGFSGSLAKGFSQKELEREISRLLV